VRPLRRKGPIFPACVCLNAWVCYRFGSSFVYVQLVHGNRRGLSIRQVTPISYVKAKAVDHHQWYASGWIARFRKKIYHCFRGYGLLGVLYVAPCWPPHIFYNLYGGAGRTSKRRGLEPKSILSTPCPKASSAAFHAMHLRCLRTRRGVGSREGNEAAPERGCRPPPAAVSQCSVGSAHHTTGDDVVVQGSGRREGAAWLRCSPGAQSSRCQPWTL
jgi:hypothetical protein